MIAAPNVEAVRREESCPSMEEIRRHAVLAAEENGLKPPFTVSGPDRQDYPVRGHGYVVTIQENSGKGRLGTARYDSAGNPTLWTMDGTLAW